MKVGSVSLFFGTLKSKSLMHLLMELLLQRIILKNYNIGFLLIASALRKQKEQSNDGQLASVLRAITYWSMKVGSVSLFFGTLKSKSLMHLLMELLLQRIILKNYNIGFLLIASALRKQKEQSNDGQLASVLRLVPRSVILSSQERGKMAVIQYEKASTHSSDNIYVKATM